MLTFAFAKASRLVLGVVKYRIKYMNSQYKKINIIVNNMAKPRSQSQRDRDRLKISGLYLQGKTQWEIKEIIGVSQGTVSNDLRALQKAWMESSLLNINEGVAKELRRINFIEREAWESWASSKTETTFGDTKYLQIVQWCIDRRCKIIGFDAPQKHEIRETIKTENTDKLKKVVAKMTDEQRKTFFEIIEKNQD